MSTYTLHHGDCLDILPTLAPASVDAVICDPPFGIGFKYTSRETFNDPVHYWQWLEPIYREMERIVKPGGLIAIWQTQLNFKYFWDWFGDDIHIYCAAKNFVQLRKTPINYGYDPVIMRYVSGNPLRPIKPKRNIDFFVANTAAMVSKPDRIERQHPCPRPIDQVMEIVDSFSLPGGLVVDPFMGSGTTGAACGDLNRSFIGIEKDAAYFTLGSDRIATAYAPLRAMEVAS
jgi:adenine-specific DNA-methyltransferase